MWLHKKLLWILKSTMVSWPKLERGFCCLMHSTFMMKLLLHTLSTEKPLVGSGSLEGRCICGNVRVFCLGVIVSLSVVLAPSCNLGLCIIYYGFRPPLFFLPFLLLWTVTYLWIILFSQCSYVHFIFGKRVKVVDMSYKGKSQISSITGHFSVLIHFFQMISC